MDRGSRRLPATPRPPRRRRPAGSRAGAGGPGGSHAPRAPPEPVRPGSPAERWSEQAFSAQTRASGSGPRSSAASARRRQRSAAPLDRQHPTQVGPAAMADRRRPPAPRPACRAASHAGCSAGPAPRPSPEISPTFFAYSKKLCEFFEMAGYPKVLRTFRVWASRRCCNVETSEMFPHKGTARKNRRFFRVCGWPHGPKGAEGVADTTSKRLEGVRPVTAHGSASAAESW